MAIGGRIKEKEEEKMKEFLSFPLFPIQFEVFFAAFPIIAQYVFIQF
jgi:hypothetical protein